MHHSNGVATLPKTDFTRARQPRDNRRESSLEGLRPAVAFLYRKQKQELVNRAGDFGRRFSGRTRMGIATCW